MKMRAALLLEPNGKFIIEEVDLAAPRRGEVLIKIAASGVCHSDWHVATGTTRHPMPVITGHEGAGVVQAVGEGVTRIKPGDHVSLSWTPDCGECFYCQRNQPNLCETFTEPIWAGVMLDGTSRASWNGETVYIYSGLGTFAEYTVVPEQSCVVIDRSIPLEVAALVGCAVATGVGAALYTAQVRPGESVVVYGAGGIGLNILQGAALAGATTIIAVDTNDEKMSIARQFGATHTVFAGKDALSQIRALTGGRGADHVFEAVGLPALQEASLEAARPGGMVTLVGLSPMGTGTNLPGAVITRTEKTIKGSYYGSVSPKRDFPLFLQMYQQGRLKLDELVSRRYTLDQINEAYTEMLMGRIARGIIVFE
jgi:S-(hydroxymethyl)glutathione dehydrogenase / alcohol dehydrogenase